MESPEFSMLSSLRGDFKSEDYIQPHYKESYRLAIDHLLSGGRDSYLEFLKGERVGSFLSDDELLFITANVEQLTPENETEEINDSPDNQSSSGTYWPLDSDVDTPDLDIGWPDVMHDMLETNIDLLFHPPRQNNPTIKEVIRKNIQDARQVIAIVMDAFTDVDIFREIVDASIRGVPVYVLLDDFNLKGFLAMAETQDVKIQHLRNMRVRTVKGQDYLCRSGAKFHGAMEQKFLLVDCHTTIYGSYSYTWSFEKINLSMVQVIRGHLVKSYDEEFRTLFARSNVPAELSPPEGTLQRKALQGCQILEKSHSAQKIDRRDQLRHTLDNVYRKTCERKLGTRDLEERLMEEEPKYLRPLIENGIGVKNHLSPLQSADAMNFYKRHSYAGERQDETTPQNMMPRASNWNISRETRNGTKHHPMDYLQVPQMYRGQNIRQSYNGSDKQVLVMQQNMPTLENTSKAFMRTLRIESYLQKPDDPFGDSCDYLDQFESRDKAGSYAQGRVRSSLVFRSNMQEQMDPNRRTNNTSPSITSSAAQNVPLHYSSMQWNPTAGDNRMNNDEFMLKRKSLQILDDSCSNAGYGPGRNAHHSIYSSYGRAKGGQILTNPDILADNWHKRHSVADPRLNTEYRHETSGHMYDAFARMQVHRGTSGIHAQNGGYGLNLNGDQRSISHHDVKSITGTKGPNWQEPPSRTVSAALLDVNSKDVTAKSNRMGSQHFQQKKMVSNIPERKEDSVGTEETSSLKSSTSTDTLTSENEKTTSTCGSVRSSSVNQRRWLQDDHLNSKPRFATEDHQTQASNSKTTTQRKSTIFDKSTRSGLDVGSWGKNRGAENRLYSRFEPFCSVDKKQEREHTKNFSKGETATEHSLTRTTRGHHENKLEKFFQRVGNLIHKNK